MWLQSMGMELDRGLLRISNVHGGWAGKQSPQESDVLKGKMASAYSQIQNTTGVSGRLVDHC